MDTLVVQEETPGLPTAGVKVTNSGIKWEVAGSWPKPDNRPKTPAPQRLLQGMRPHTPRTCWGDEASERKQRLLKQRSEALRTLNNQIIVAQEMKREEEEAARANRKRILAENMARAFSAKASGTNKRRARAANYNNDVSIKVELATMNKGLALGEEENQKKMPPRRLPPLSKSTAWLELRKEEDVFAPRPRLPTEAERDILSGGSAVLDLPHEDISDTKATLNKSLVLDEEETLKRNRPRELPLLSMGTARSEFPRELPSLSMGTAPSEFRIEEEAFAPKPRLLTDAERDILNPHKISFREKIQKFFKKVNRVGPMPQVEVCDNETKKDVAKDKKHGLWCRLKKVLRCGGH